MCSADSLYLCTSGGQSDYDFLLWRPNASILVSHHRTSYGRKSSQSVFVVAQPMHSVTEPFRAVRGCREEGNCDWYL